MVKVDEGIGIPVLITPWSAKFLAGSLNAAQARIILEINADPLTIELGGTGANSAIQAFDNLSPLNTLGDVLTHNGTNNIRLAGQTTTTKKFLSQTGNGSISALPVWAQVAPGDLTGWPANAAGFLQNNGSGTLSWGTPTGGSGDEFDSTFSFWKLDEYSGTRYDSHGNNHLTELGGAVDSDLGVNGRAALFTSADQFGLKCATPNAALAVGDYDWFFACRYYLNNPLGLSENRYIVVKPGDDDNEEFAVVLEEASIDGRGIVFYIAGADESYPAVASSEEIIDGEWVFIAAWYNKSESKLYLRVNDTVDSQAITTTPAALDGSEFVLGHQDDNFTEFQTQGFDGLIDDVMFARWLPSTALLDALQAGATYPESFSAGGVMGFANPTASVGLTAVNGSASTAMRSDGAPALDVGIAPTWTQSHLFQAGLAVGTNDNTLTRSTNDLLYSVNSANAIYFQVVNNAGKRAYFGTTSGGNTLLMADTGKSLYLSANNDGNGLVVISQYGVIPISDNSIPFGDPSIRWQGGYFSVGVFTPRKIQARSSTPTNAASAESFSHYTNTGASGATTINLPAAAAGLTYSFSIEAAQTLTVAANGTDTIRIAGTASSAGGNISSGTIGDCIALICSQTGKWVSLAHEGTWTIA